MMSLRKYLHIMTRQVKLNTRNPPPSHSYLETPILPMHTHPCRYIYFLVVVVAIALYPIFPNVFDLKIDFE